MSPSPSSGGDGGGGGGGAEVADSAGTSTDDARSGTAGAGAAAAAAAAAGDIGGGGAGNPRPGDIEREVRQQGGMRDDKGASARSDDERGPERERGGEESLAVSQARALLLQGLISEEELEAVVQKDQVSHRRGSCEEGARDDFVSFSSALFFVVG